MQDAQPLNPLQIFLNNSSWAFGYALWIGLAIVAVLWLVRRLIILGSRYDNDGPVAIASGDAVALAGYGVLALLALYIVTYLAAGFINNTMWFWFPDYIGEIVHGIWITLQMLVLSLVIGFLLAVPVGLVQVTGPEWLSLIARSYCTLIRGTPLLIQLWLLYYGLGSVFQSFPEIRQSFIWPILRDSYYYGVLALTLSVIGYEAEIMRGAFLAVPRGELEAGSAFGMSKLTLLRRIWLPRAFRLVLPTLGGEIISQLKSTPVIATVAIYDLYGVSRKIAQVTYRTYEPLLLAAVCYFILVFFLTRIINYVEAQVPQKR